MLPILIYKNIIEYCHRDCFVPLLRTSRLFNILANEIIQTNKVLIKIKGRSSQEFRFVTYKEYVTYMCITPEIITSGIIDYNDEKRESVEITRITDRKIIQAAIDIGTDIFTVNPHMFYNVCFKYFDEDYEENSIRSVEDILREIEIIDNDFSQDKVDKIINFIPYHISEYILRNSKTLQYIVHKYNFDIYVEYIEESFNNKLYDNISAFLGCKKSPRVADVLLNKINDIDEFLQYTRIPREFIEDFRNEIIIYNHYF